MTRFVSNLGIFSMLTVSFVAMLDVLGFDVSAEMAAVMLFPVGFSCLFWYAADILLYGRDVHRKYKAMREREREMEYDELWQDK